MQWQPRTLNDIVGNTALKEYITDFVYGVRQKSYLTGFSALITGESRGGKTSAIALGIKCIGCYNLDIDTLTPCNKCFNCTHKNHLYGNRNWERVEVHLGEELITTPISYSYTPLDCSSLNDSGITALIESLQGDSSQLKIVTLDEVHRLSRRVLDERLLTPIDNIPANWIAMSAQVKKDSTSDSSKLEKMLQNRFTYRIETQKPSVDEMTTWLAKRCEEFEITCKTPNDTLSLLARRSNRLPGMALNVLTIARNKQTRELTPALVESHIFDFDE